jgi:hypothetical protein
MRMIDGIPVVDAEKPVTIHITRADCERGSKKDPTRCAAALALKRSTRCNESRVHLGCTYLRFGNKWLRYATPPSLKAEIISFDRGGGFYPGDFRLRPMPPSLRLRSASEKSPLKVQRKPTLLLRPQEEAGGDKETPKTEHLKAARRSEKKVKAEPRVFHRVKGVREHASSS